MSSLGLCIRSVCYKIMALVGIARQKPKTYEGEDQFGENSRISTTSWGQEEEAPIQDKQKLINKSVSDTLETEGLLLVESPKKSKVTKSIPTKDEPLLQEVNTEIEELSPPKAAPEVQPFTISTASFKINLQPYQNFYEILQNKTKNLQEKLNSNSTLVQIDKTPYNLEIRHSEAGKLNIFTYRFRLPCTYSFYSQMLNDYVLQKRLDSNIDEYKMLQLYANNLRLNYLSYKKVLIVSPRDFVYLKYSNNVDNEYWEISFSIPYESFPNKVRGEILLNSCKVIEKGEEIEVQVYSQVDMKLSVGPKITKNQAVNEIKKYVDKCDKYIKENYRREIV